MSPADSCSTMTAPVIIVMIQWQTACVWAPDVRRPYTTARGRTSMCAAHPRNYVKLRLVVDPEKFFVNVIPLVSGAWQWCSPQVQCLSSQIPAFVNPGHGRERERDLWYRILNTQRLCVLVIFEACRFWTLNGNTQRLFGPGLQDQHVFLLLFWTMSIKPTRFWYFFGPGL